jgi:hypothetical protein
MQRHQREWMRKCINTGYKGKCKLQALYHRVLCHKAMPLFLQATLLQILRQVQSLYLENNHCACSTP